MLAHRPGSRNLSHGLEPFLEAQPQVQSGYADSALPSLVSEGLGASHGGISTAGLPLDTRDPQLLRVWSRDVLG